MEESSKGEEPPAFCDRPRPKRQISQLKLNAGFKKEVAERAVYEFESGRQNEGKG
jgi:hypothetical protein